MNANKTTLQAMTERNCDDGRESGKTKENQNLRQ